MNFLSKKSIALFVVGMFLLVGAVSPMMTQASPNSNTGSVMQHHQPQFSPDQAAQNMADTFGVSKEDVLTYHQQGTSFQDLSRASFLAKASGKSLSEVLTAKTLANSWKDVSQSLGVTPEIAKATRQDITANRLGKLGIAKDTALSLIQQGYHTRDIAVANELAKNTNQSIPDVLALKKINNSWPDVAQTLGVDKDTFTQDMQNLQTVFPFHGHHRGFPQGGF